VRPHLRCRISQGLKHPKDHFGGHRCTGDLANAHLKCRALKADALADFREAKKSRRLLSEFELFAASSVKAMNSQIDFSSLASLAQEPPSTLMGCVRMACPHIEAALKQKVTLKVIHQRLNAAGIPISYKLLSVYVGRMQHDGAPQPVQD